MSRLSLDEKLWPKLNRKASDLFAKYCVAEVSSQEVSHAIKKFIYEQMERIDDFKINSFHIVVHESAAVIDREFVVRMQIVVLARTYSKHRKKTINLEVNLKAILACFKEEDEDADDDSQLQQVATE